jgi:hypothetical protein
MIEQSRTSTMDQQTVLFFRVHLPFWGSLISDRLGKGLRGHKPILKFCQHELAVASQELFPLMATQPLPRVKSTTNGTYRATCVSIVHGGTNLATVEQMEQIFRQNRSLFGDCRSSLARG